MNPWMMNPWIWIPLSIVLIVLIIYIIGSLDSGGSMIKSVWVQQLKEINADQLYYLPAATLQMNATAKVITIKNASTGNITGATLAELVFNTTVQIAPDTANAFAIRYIGSAFSNDDLKFVINASGLIEGINLTAEDRIASIIAQVSEAPGIILTGEQAAEARLLNTSEGLSDTGVALIYETKEYTNTFYILSDEIRNKTAMRSWIINIDGTANAATTVDASFLLKFVTTEAQALSFETNPVKEFTGIITRPLQTITMNIFRNGNTTNPDAKYQLVIPDESRAVVVPVKRAPFVKKTYGFKMTNGLLTENIINIPSQIEGFMSIPVKIAKALVSIPAQLFHFKVENIKRQTTLETEEQKLAKALLDSNKNIIAQDAELAKAKLEAEKMVLVAQKDMITTQKDIVVAKKDWEDARKELEDLLKKIEEARKKPA